MADVNANPPKANGAAKRPRGPSRAQMLNKIYSLPAPVRTFPLPTFIASNPVSLVHLIYAWVSQILSPPKSLPETAHVGLWSFETRSIHVTNPQTIRALWEQGFYGKGSLSRSEPSWLDREKRRRGTNANETSEEHTRKRRAERQQAKWERARKEREAIDQKLEEERRLAEVSRPSSPSPERKLVDERRLSDASNLLTPSPSPSPEILPPPLADALPPSILQSHVKAPVGPLELLALPNCHTIVEKTIESAKVISPQPHLPVALSAKIEASLARAPVGPLELLALPNSILPALHVDVPIAEVVDSSHNISHGLEKVSQELDEEPVTPAPLVQEPAQVEESNQPDLNGKAIDSQTSSVTPQTPPGSPKRQKSVRFSPTVEKTTFLQNDPPSPELDALDSTSKSEEEPLVIQDQEHLQLSAEEAFFLNYGLGVLQVMDPENGQPISTKDLFTLLRQTSYFPPSDASSLSSDDPFLINYIVYHHFRSLGWCVRAGTKFSVDFVLYNRGPVFSHAEFAVLVLPSYSDAYWQSTPALKEHAAKKAKRTWPWLHAINRVNTQVKKTLLLCYVDIPAPLDAAVEGQAGIDEILKRYTVREVVMKRWISNRSRD